MCEVWEGNGRGHTGGWPPAPGDGELVLRNWRLLTNLAADPVFDMSVDHILHFLPREGVGSYWCCRNLLAHRATGSGLCVKGIHMSCQWNPTASLPLKFLQPR